MPRRKSCYRKPRVNKNGTYNRLDMLHNSRCEKRKKSRRKDPMYGVGKKPKGSDRRLYTNENPGDTVKIGYKTVKDARETVKRVKKVRKSFARKIQILTVMEQRARFAGKKSQEKIARAGKNAIRRMYGRPIRKISKY